MVSFLFGFWVLLAWVSSGCPDLSSTEVDTGTGEVSLLIPSSRSRIKFHLLLVKKTRMKKMMRNDSPVSKSVFDVDEDPEDELDKPGTTIGTKFSMLQSIRIPFLMRCGF